MKRHNFNELTPEEVLQPSRLDEFEKRMGIFRDELVYLHTSLSLLRQIYDHDFRLFPDGGTFFRFVARNLTTQSVMIATRLWGDKTKKSLTLDKFRTWLSGSVQRRYFADLESLLDSVWPDSRFESLVEGFRGVRHADLAHLDQHIKLGIKTRPTPVKFNDLEQVADRLGAVFNSVNFGAEMQFVLVNLDTQNGRSHEGQLGFILDRLALDSKAFRFAQNDELLWSEYKAQLSPREMTTLNALRGRHGLEPWE